jgi:hypothetical protein
VTSGKGNIGKTTTTANLTASLARLSLPVVADAGLRKLDLLLGLKNHVHLTIADVLAGDCRLNQALIRHRALQDLQLLCLSKPRSKLSLAFGSKTLTWVIDALRRAPNPPAFILIDACRLALGTQPSRRLAPGAAPPHLLPRRRAGALPRCYPRRPRRPGWARHQRVSERGGLLGDGVDVGGGERPGAAHLGGRSQNYRRGSGRVKM